MICTILDAPQRSDEWVQARLGRLTSSRAADCLATIKSGGEAAGRRNLRIQLVLERLTNRSMESGYQSAAMLQGIEREADAIAAYEAITGHILTRTGFLTHPSLMVGCSLDGHVGNFIGIVEAKAPMAATHWEYLRTGVIPGVYQKQIMHALWLTGADWCDWLTFHPDFLPNLRTRLVRVERDEATIAEYERKAVAFLAEVDSEVLAVATMNNLHDQLAAAAGAGR